MLFPNLERCSTYYSVFVLLQRIIGFFFFSFSFPFRHFLCLVSPKAASTLKLTRFFSSSLVILFSVPPSPSLLARQPTAPRLVRGRRQIAPLPPRPPRHKLSESPRRFRPANSTSTSTSTLTSTSIPRSSPTAHLFSSRPPDGRLTDPTQRPARPPFDLYPGHRAGTQQPSLRIATKNTVRMAEGSYGSPFYQGNMTPV